MGAHAAGFGSVAVGPVKGVLLRRVRKSQCGTFYQSTCIPLSGGLHSQHISTLRPFLYIARSFVRSFVRAVGCERRLRSRRASLKGRFRGPLSRTSAVLPVT